MNYQYFRKKGFIEEESIRVLSEGNSPEESLDYMLLNAVQWKLPIWDKKRQIQKWINSIKEWTVFEWVDKYEWIKVWLKPC